MKSSGHKKLLLPLLLCAIPSFGNSPSNALDAYIEEKLTSFHHAERAKSIKSALIRVQSENWWDDDETFTNISDQLNHVLSCYIYAVGDNQESLDLIDEIEFLVANTDDRKFLYQKFIKKDSKLKHEMVPEEDCY